MVQAYSKEGEDRGSKSNKDNLYLRNEGKKKTKNRWGDVIENYMR